MALGDLSWNEPIANYYMDKLLPVFLYLKEMLTLKKGQKKMFALKANYECLIYYCACLALNIKNSKINLIKKLLGCICPIIFPNLLN